MILPSYFRDFLAIIRPQDSIRQELKKAHLQLRDQLEKDIDLDDIVVATFLQGSYKRFTAVRTSFGVKADVDIVVVTNLDKALVEPQEALLKFKAFLDKHYPKKWKLQGRSIGIELEQVCLDLVVTAAPSEANQEAIRSIAQNDVYDLNEESFLAINYIPKGSEADLAWRNEPLYIPDRDAGKWQATHPLRQIQWTKEKNAECNGHYINVVKALKWWRKELDFEKENPKSYPLEHLIGISCPDGIASVAEGAVGCMEDITSKYRKEVANGQVPFLPDHGIPQHNVLERISPEEFSEFHHQVVDASVVARRAFDSDSVRDSCMAWREIFGEDFPECPEGSDGSDDDDRGGYTSRKKVSEVKPARYA